MQSQSFRPYRSKRKRPCDLCRSRKVCCQVETEPPCTNCRLNNTPCTFVQPASKRPKPNTTFLASGLDGDQQHSSSFLSTWDATNMDALLIDPIPIEESLATIEMGQPNSATTQEPQHMDLLDTGWQTLYLESQQGEHAEQPSHNRLTLPALNELHTHVGPLHEVEPNEEANEQLSQHRETADPPRQNQSVHEDGQSLDDIDGFSAQMFGLSGESDPYLLRHFHWDEHDERRFVRVHFRRLGSSENGVPVHFALAKDELALGLKSETEMLDNFSRQRLDKLIPPEDGRRLIRLFLIHVFPLFPIISQTKLQITRDDFSPSLATISQMPPHLLAAIYATALPFCAYDDYLCVSNGYKLPNTAELWRIVQAALSVEMHTPHLSTIQASLLYTQRPPTPGTSAAADTPMVRATMAAVVAQATSLGLHLDCHEWKIPDWEKRLRRRLWWAILTEEKFGSMLRGVPSLISDDDWDVGVLTDEDFATTMLSDQSDSEQSSLGVKHDCTGFRHLASLALIISDIQASFYTVKSARRWSADLLGSLQLSQSIRERLQSWLDSYSRKQAVAAAELDIAAENASANLSEGPLRFAYFISKLFLFRALLRPLGRSSLSPDDHIFDYTLEFEDQSVQEVIDTSEMLAREISTFVQKLDGQDFSAFWYSWLRIGFATMTNFVVLLYAQAPTRERADKARNMAERWRQILRMKSRSFEQMKLGLLRLDSIFWIGIDKIFEGIVA